MKKNGIPVKKDWIIEADFEAEDGYQSFMKLLETGDLPKIILAVNDRVALGAYKAILKLVLIFPEISESSDMGLVKLHSFLSIADDHQPGSTQNGTHCCKYIDR